MEVVPMFEILAIMKENGGAATIIAAMISITGIIIGAILNKNLQKSVLKKEQKMRFQNLIGDKVVDSLISLRDLELETKTYEFYDIEHRLETQENDIDFIEPEAVYPAIMSNKETFVKYISRLNQFRSCYEKYLSYNVAAYLWYGTDYFMNIVTYISQIGMDHKYPEMGIIFIFDIQKWCDNIEKAIVKDINKRPVKLVVHRGRRWEHAKRKAQNKLYKKSVLNEIKTNPNGEAAKLIQSFLNNFK